MKKPKCKDCPDRYVTDKSNCHATCKNYLDWQAEHRAELERIRKIKNNERNISEVIKTGLNKDYRKYK